MQKKILLIPLITFLLIALIFFYLLIIERNPSSIPSAILNKNVPIFSAETLIRKEKFNSSVEFGSELVLVNFFATWCKPCADEHHNITRFKKEKNIKIVGINYKDKPEKTIKWLKKLGNPYSVIAIDKKGNISIDWGVYGLPETFVVSSQGLIKFRHVGPVTDKIYKKISLIIDSEKNGS